MKLVLALILLSSLFSCTSEPSLTGKWKIDIELQGQKLPVLLDLVQNKNVVSGSLINSTEKIAMTGTVKDGQFSLEIGTNYALINGSISKDKITGKWIRTNKKDFGQNFKGVKSFKESLFISYEKKATLIDISGNWKIQLSEDNFGLGVFKQKGSRVQGSILTSTGDYRYLDGYIEHGQVKLFGFDGVFSFILDLKLSDSQMNGMMFSGKSYNKQINAIRDETFKLADPNTLTTLTDKKPFNLKLKDLDGNLIDFNGPNYKNKAKIVQLFGSWCPNCIDETRFFLNWRKENMAKLNDIAFVAVSYENFDTLVKATKNLKKMQYKLKMDYPIILGDFKSTKSVSKIFPIKKTVAFPTTFFLNKKNEIVKVHTGFSGQATGPFFDGFKVEFQDLVVKLINSEI